MSTTVKGVIAREKGATVELVDVVIPDPGPHDVVVRVQACGVCHTDVAYRDGGIGENYPYLLGHEAAGIVETIGEAVSHVAVGDFVVLNWRAVCGECRACKKGQPQYCFATFNASAPMTLADGTVLEAALGIGAFVEKTLVHEGQCTKVNPDADPAAAGLLGCGIMAGVGAAVNTGAVQRGETVAVIGCGGVGMAAIAGATLAGATRIIAIDLSEEKLERARKFGATDVINPTSLPSAAGVAGEDQPVVAAVHEILGGVGADVVVDAVGIPATFRQAFYSRDLAGRVVLVGVPTPEMQLDLPLQDVFSRGGAVKSSWYGDCLPERDFPLYTDLYLQGRFPLGDFIDERIGINQVEDAFSAMKAGTVLRSVVEL